VESKSFEIVKHAFELNIIEIGRNHVSNVSMGFAAAYWFRDALLEIAKLSNDQNVFRSFREGNKVFVVQKQRNARGRFVSVTVLGDSKGRDAWGWRGVSHEINGLLLAKATGPMVGNQWQTAAANHTAQENPNSNPRKEYPTFKAAVNQGETIPNISHV
jgi:hypothetical protein